MVRGATIYSACWIARLLVLERRLVEAVRDCDRRLIELLRAEATRRFAGTIGMPRTLMMDGDAAY